MHYRPSDIGVAGGLGARSAVGDLATRGGGALDGQEGRGDIVPSRVPLNPSALDRVLRLKHQRVLGLKAVVNRRRPRVEIAHQIKHAIPDTRDIDADVLHVETIADLLHLGGLVGERVAAPRVLFQNAELAALLQRRRNHHTRGIVPRAAGVVTQPHRRIAEGPFGFRVSVVVGPQRAVRITPFQIRQAERALDTVDELAKVDLLKHLVRVFQAQLLKIKQIAATGHRIENVDDLAPLTVRAQRPLAQLRLAGERLIRLLVFGATELVPRPERIGLMADSTGCREIRLAPLLVGGHRTGQIVELLEVADPEILIHVHMAVITLRGTAVCTEKPQLGTVTQNDRVTGQL